MHPARRALRQPRQPLRGHVSAPRDPRSGGRRPLHRRDLGQPDRRGRVRAVPPRGGERGFRAARAGRGARPRDHAPARARLSARAGGGPEKRTLFAVEKQEGPICCVPLLHEEKLVGLLSIYALLSHKAAFTPLDRELLELLSGQAAVALVSSQSHRLDRPETEDGPAGHGLHQEGMTRVDAAAVPETRLRPTPAPSRAGWRICRSATSCRCSRSAARRAASS